MERAPLTPSQITGVLLAGGQSRRMGGGDKGLIDLAGRPMLARVIERVAPQCGRLVINANGDPARFAAFGLDVVADTVPGFVGPLAGVLAGMRWSRENVAGAPAVLTVSTDAPFLPLDLGRRLAEALARRPGAIALARSAGELHPVIGLWPVALADDLERALNDGVRKVLHWTDRHGTLGVDFDVLDIAGARVDPFYNANTPEELAEARRLLEVPVR
jgi:molybdopterin-guanine dinucleotide biosynthesis protein A